MSKLTPASMAAAGLGLLLATGVQAATFTDRASFQAASRDLTTVEFELAPLPGTGPVSWWTFGYVEGGVTFSSMSMTGDNPFYLGFVRRAFEDEDSPLSYATSDYISVEYTTVTFPTGVTAVGFDYASDAGITVVVDGSELLLDSAAEEFAFFGIVRPGEFSTIFITTSGAGLVHLDDLSFGFRAVPEPSGLSLLVGGLIAAAMRRGRLPVAAGRPRSA